MFGFNKSKKRKVTAVIPTGFVLYRFRALKDFWSDAFKSQYVVDSVYSVRQGNDRLGKIVMEQWVPQGKVEVL